GAMEDVTIEGCTSGYYQNASHAQITNLVIRNMQPTNAYDIYFASGTMKLVNCNIKPEQIKWDPGFPAKPLNDKPRPPAIESLQFLVTQLKGPFPPGAGIEVRTAMPAAPLAPGAADPNVRNSPAPVLTSGLTPLPKSLEPLIVRSWMYDADKNFIKAPEYQLKVLAPQGAAGAERPVLKTISITP